MNDTQLSNHFKLSEFVCKCGKCNGANPSPMLLRKLELLHTGLNCKYILVTSGYRCPEYSVKVGGYMNDAHTKNIAADVICYAQNGNIIPVETVAAYAEKIGFTGIGLMSGGAIHLDIRNKTNYYNDKWFGDERTGKDVTTFQNYTQIADDNIVTIGGKKYKLTFMEV